MEVVVKNTLDTRGAAASGPVSLTVNRFTSLILTQFLDWKISMQLLGMGKNSQSLILVMLTTKFALMMIQRNMLPSILTESYTDTRDFLLV